ncbi:AGE family epimerase/isomerase [Occultella gossypii]|uniref:AGE family epimerase/isomerase n=1 Tax=Occultella gossypii TaxID=2800820 RepID=A0ABS7SI71_9MICO|nr:AGE family epimerase/isomerase [Occultella gossypii]MBZ2199539.1 AGE family epimerase/isomerase [Occultella gossypii]
MSLPNAPGQAREQLESIVLPFWLEHGVDERDGGFHTCFDNRGRTRTSTDKFTWSQGRFVWLLARAADLGHRGSLDVDGDRLLALATTGARFLESFAVRADGTSRFALVRTGHAAAPGHPDRSVYADCFVAMGLAELGRVTGEPHWLELARPIVERARTDIRAGTAPTPPYDVPAGYQAFGPRMILLNTLLVFAQAELSLHRSRSTFPWLLEGLDAMLEHRLPDGTFAEMTGPDPESLIGRHRVPGHAIEGIWMALEAMPLVADERDRNPLLDSIGALCTLGWDRELGGLLRFTDSSGAAAPTGTTSGTPYEDLVARTWSTKLWWVHSEAAATTAIAATRYGHGPSAQWFQQIWDYTLTTFPGRGDGEEWIQIRDRNGRPLDEVVALPVKDPYHVARNLMQIVELGRS